MAISTINNSETKQQNTIYKSVSFAIFILFVIFPVVVHAYSGCDQVSGFTMTPSIPDLPDNTGGMLSPSWHSALLQVECDGLGSTYVITNKIIPASPDTGRAVWFNGVSYRLYATNVNDVFFIGSVTGPDAIERPFGTPYEHGLRPPKLAPFNFNATVKIRFYSTSTSMRFGVYNISALQLVSGRIESVGYLQTSSMKSSAFSFVVKGPSCLLSAPANVLLRSVNTASLRAVGDTSLGANFQLNVNCGSNTPAYKISYSLVDIYNTANTSDTLTLEGAGGTASGVSLKIMDGVTPVIFGPLSEGLIGNNPTGGSIIGKPLSAHYVRTASSIKPGTVKAGVSITLSYE